MAAMHADCTFADFGPRAVPVRVHGRGGAAVFERCRFKAADVIQAGQEHAEAMVSASSGASIYIKNCTLQNTPDLLSSMIQVCACASTCRFCDCDVLLQHACPAGSPTSAAPTGMPFWIQFVLKLANLVFLGRT